MPLSPGDGSGFTVTDVVVAIVLPQELVAVNVYIPAEAVPTVIATGDRAVDV